MTNIDVPGNRAQKILSLFVDDMIMYIENLTEYTQKMF